MPVDKLPASGEGYCRALVSVHMSWLACLLMPVLNGYHKNFLSRSRDQSIRSLSNSTPTMADSSAPLQLSSPQDTFEALQRQFKFDPKVTAKILDLGIGTLSDCRWYAKDEDEVKVAFVDSIRDLEGPRLQAARVRHAWAACKALVDSQQQAKSQPLTVEDEDTLLPSDELRDLKVLWFRRYHLKPEPEYYPSDRVLSKVVRCLRKRTLEVVDVWSMRSLTHQRTHTTKRRKIGENLFTQEDDDTEVEAHTAWNYLRKLDIYLMALSIAGVRRVEPPPAEQEGPGGNSVDYVAIPYDILLKYKTRAESLVLKLPDQRRMAVLSHLDTQERAVWSSRFGAEDVTLGKIVQEVMKERDALWIGGAVMGTSSHAAAAPQPGPVSPGGRGGGWEHCHLSSRWYGTLP